MASRNPTGEETDASYQYPTCDVHKLSMARVVPRILGVGTPII
jgi:hypothetical protein